MNKKTGGIEYTGSLMMVCLTGLLLLFCICVKEVRVYQAKIRDSVDASALAAAVIDIDKLYKEQAVIISDAKNSKNIFLKTLKYNLSLNDDMSPFTIHDFKVYNILNDNNVEELTVDVAGNVYTAVYPYDAGVKTPDGTQIQGATIYVDVGLYVDGFLGGENYEHVVTSVDVVKDGSNI